MTRNDIAKVSARVPRLTKFGIGIYENGRGLTEQQKRSKFEQSQQQLLDSEQVCTRVSEWLTVIHAMKTINKKHSSYGLKHMAERAIGEYVANGAFIAAAIHCGFPFKLIDSSPNVRFGMSERSLAQSKSQDFRRLD